MEGQHHDAMKLQQLPVEILHTIFFYAQNPFLSHVCRTLRLALPSFTSYSRELAQHAFGADICFDQEMLDRFYFRPNQPRWTDFKKAIRSTVDVDRSCIQEFMCAQWFTVKHLRKIRRWNIQAGVESVYRIAEAEFSNEDRQGLNQFLEKVENEPFAFVRNTPIYGHLRDISRYWIRTITGKGGKLKIFVNPNNFELMPFQDAKIGLVMLPFLPADHIPQQLFRQIAKFDQRSQELAEELAWIRIYDWSSGCPWARTGNDDIFGPGGRQTLSQCIVQILDSIHAEGQSQVNIEHEIVQKCMRTLVGFDNVMFRAEAVTFSWRDDVSKQYFTMPMLQLGLTQAKDRPIRIKHIYYEHCFRSLNVNGLKLLVLLNHAMYNPNLGQLKEMMTCHIRRSLCFGTDCDNSIVDMDLESMIAEAERRGEPEWKEMLDVLEDASRKARDRSLIPRQEQSQKKRHVALEHELREPRKREDNNSSSARSDSNPVWSYEALGLR